LLSLSALAQSVAVLPFVNTTSAEVPQAGNLDWIGESIAETLREAFALRGLASLDREHVEEALATLGLKSRSSLTEASILKIGEALDAELVMYGSFAFTPAARSASAETMGRLRIQARVIDRRRLRQTPQVGEEGSLEDLAKLEAHLAWRGLTLIDARLAPPEAEAAALRPAIRLDAEENFVRGLLAEGGDREKYFKQAASLEPRFSRPSFYLGKMYYERKQYRDAAGWLERVSATDVRSREARFLLGVVRFELGDYAAAQKWFQGIAATVPLNEAYNNVGAAESRRNLPQAAENFRKALEGDPNDPDYHFNLGFVLWKKGDFAAAAEQFRAVLVRDPDDQNATILLGRCLKKQGFRGATGPDARFQALERLKTNYDERVYWQLKSAVEPRVE
jgi:tetratricopeptide (TPR) repeat protein